MVNNLDDLENIKYIKYKLSIYNKINYYQLLLINDIDSTILNIFGNMTNKNILLFSKFYKKLLEKNTNKNIIYISYNTNYNQIFDLYNRENNSIVFLSNNNNIFSKIWSKRELFKMFRDYPQIIFIIDETYSNENSFDIFSCAEYINKFHNIIVIKTSLNTYDNNKEYIKYIVSNVNLINNLAKYN